MFWNTAQALEAGETYADTISTENQVPFDNVTTLQRNGRADGIDTYHRARGMQHCGDSSDGGIGGFPLELLVERNTMR